MFVIRYISEHRATQGGRSRSFAVLIYEYDFFNSIRNNASLFASKASIPVNLI